MRKSTEAMQILKNSTMERLAFLNKINKDEGMKKEARALLGELLHLAETFIARSAGGVNSLDTMIDASVNQSFYRGRISLAVLMNALIENSSAELEKREELKRRK
jgi:hypothetical protein